MTIVLRVSCPSSSARSASLVVHMSERERAAFEAFLSRTGSYVEFGAGGSTVLAASKVKNSVVALDSSQIWLDNVALACATDQTAVTPNLMQANIGPTGDWGSPTDDSFKNLWPSYSQLIWDAPQAHNADLYLIDGRFRVACFLDTLLHCRPDSIILIHDFAPRAEYHVVREYAREILAAESLSAFIRRSNLDHAKLQSVLATARYHPG